jgi:hypothetical protein
MQRRWQRRDEVTLYSRFVGLVLTIGFGRKTMICDDLWCISVFVTCFGGSPSEEESKIGNIYKKTNMFID